MNEFAERKYQYNLTDTEKRKIEGAIIEDIESSGGRFLKTGSKSTGWEEIVQFEEKRQKVAHALQYRVRLLRKQKTNHETTTFGQENQKAKRQKAEDLGVGKKNQQESQSIDKNQVKNASLGRTEDNTSDICCHQPVTYRLPPKSSHLSLDNNVPEAYPQFPLPVQFPDWRSDHGTIAAVSGLSLSVTEIAPFDAFDAGFVIVPISESEDGSLGGDCFDI